MLRTFQFRLRPNTAQAAMLERILADNCETYNAALQERREAWKLQRKSITYRDQQNEITELRKDSAFQWMAADIMRDPLRRVDDAFKGFFRRCRGGHKPGFPRFRSRHRYDSFSFGGCNKPVVRERSIKIPNLGDIRARGGRQIQGQTKCCTVKRDGKRWTANVVCDIGPTPEKCVVGRPIGIDMGLTALVTLSDGAQIENQRWTKQHEKRIVTASRSLSRKKKGSNNKLRAKEALRRAHQRAANARMNYIHHASKWLVENYDLIAHEDLKIRNMAKGTFAKSIMDAAWGLLIWQITYKAESAGRWVVPVNPSGTSQKCSGCGTLVQKKLSERVHSCSTCDLILGRDHNAGLNILALGMSAVEVTAESMKEFTNSCL